MVHKLVAEDEILMLPCMAQPRVLVVAQHYLKTERKLGMSAMLVTALNARSRNQSRLDIERGTRV